MLLLVDEAEKVLTDRQTDLNEFGRMLDHTWKLKRQTGNAVSTSDIDLLYEKGMKAGALGGKLLGAGGGGFLVFYVEPDKQDNVKNAWIICFIYHFSLKMEAHRLFIIHPKVMNH